MRKTTIATIVVLLAIAGVVGFILARPYLGGDVGLVRELSRSFMEDLQFKDFRSSKLYSHELDQDRLDIGKTLERLFQVKPEFLDILDYEIVRAELDESGERAKVVMRARYKVLNKPRKNEEDTGVEEAEVVLYYIMRHPDCPLGGSCPAGTCVDEQGDPMKKPDEDEGDSRHSADNPPPGPAADVEDKSEETWTCDATAEPRWFMNLDSTLKEKGYQ